MVIGEEDTLLNDLYAIELFWYFKNSVFGMRKRPFNYVFAHKSMQEIFIILSKSK